MATRAAFLILIILGLGSVALAQQHAHTTGSSPVRAAAATPASSSSASPAAAATHVDAGTVASADAAATPAAPPTPTTSSFDIPMVQRGAGAVTHFPIPEQLARNDIPVFVQVRSSAPIDHVSMFYRSEGAPRFAEVRMQPMGQDLALADGYGAVIPCEDAFPPAVEYYVQALATSGDSVGYAGTSTEPIRLPIVLHRSHEFVPTLPGQPPPRNCGGIDMSAASTSRAGGTQGRSPTAAPEGGGTADLGEPCTHTSDCHHGLRCGTNHVCVFTHTQ